MNKLMSQSFGPPYSYTEERNLTDFGLGDKWDIKDKSSKSEQAFYFHDGLNHKNKMQIIIRKFTHGK
jgi:hypothetical protein